MSNTPLEQNSVDLASVLVAINDLPEYQELPPDVTLDFFSLYDAVKIAEFTDTVNIANDTTFDPTNYVNEMQPVTIKSETSASAARSVSMDLSNYIYVATLEWFFIPQYTAVPTGNVYMTSKASVSAKVFYRDSGEISFSQAVHKYVNLSGYETELVNVYGIYPLGSFTSVSNGVLYLILPHIEARPSATNSNVTVMNAVDKANSNLYFRSRIYRVPHNQFTNKMYEMCHDMVDDEQFEGVE